MHQTERAAVVGTLVCLHIPGDGVQRYLIQAEFTHQMVGRRYFPAASSEPSSPSTRRAVQQSSSLVGSRPLPCACPSTRSTAHTSSSVHDLIMFTLLISHGRRHDESSKWQAKLDILARRAYCCHATEPDPMALPLPCQRACRRVSSLPCISRFDDQGAGGLRMGVAQLLARGWGMPACVLGSSSALRTFHPFFFIRHDTTLVSCLAGYFFFHRILSPSTLPW